MTEQEQFAAVSREMEKLRPLLIRDGGDYQLIAVEDGIVKLKLLGACDGCPSAPLTLKAGIEHVLTRKIPGIKSVIQVQ